MGDSIKELADIGTTTIDGRRVCYRSAPAQSPEGQLTDSPLQMETLLVHGLGCSSEVWLPTVGALADRGMTCRVLAPDLPGYGHSPGPRAALGMEEMADWLVRFLDDRELKCVHVAGNSMGCQVALALARRWPDRVGGLILQGPTTGERLVPPWRYVVGLAADAFAETPAYNLRLLKMYLQMGPVRYMETVKKMLDDDPIVHASEVRAPVLVIRGGHDAIVSDRTARRLADLLPHADYASLDSAAHAIEYNNPNEFADSMLGFLKKVEAGFVPEGTQSSPER